MEEQLVQLLGNTQLAEEGPRKQAELDLKRAQSNPAFPVSLANIATHTSVAQQVRQAALTTLRAFIEKNWSGDSDDGPTIPIADEAKEQVRSQLLSLALSDGDERKVKAAASYAVGKIANVDFPDQWNLLPTLLQTIQTGTDSQLHGALKVLSDLVEESLSEDQFFSMAQDIVKVVYETATNTNRKTVLRALAVSVFRGCFDLMDMVKDEHLNEVKGFAEEALKGWFPFFLEVLKLPLSEKPAGSTAQPESWNGIIALKLQVVKCLLKVKLVFPQLLLPQTPAFFSIVWEDLQLLVGHHEQMYIESDEQGRLEDSDGLPYTLDFLVLEELDFLNSCLRASPVQKELESQIKARAAVHETPWVLDLMKLTVAYARITQEEADLWDIDVSLYLAEEASVTANYTPRTACGDLLIKLGEWLHQSALEGLFAYTKTLFTGENTSWRSQEAALYLLNIIVSDFLDCDRKVAPEISQAYLEIIEYAINRLDEPLLRARGYLVAGVLVQTNSALGHLLDRTIESITRENSELVQVACIKAAEGYLKTGSNLGTSAQVKVISAIQGWVSSKDLTDMEDADDLLVTLAETIRSAINVDRRITISPEVPALDLLFLIAKHGSTNWQVTMLICEAFEDIVQNMADPQSYTALCSKVLPSLTGAFDVANVTEDNPLVTFATELMTSLTQYGSEPLPPGFIATALPKLNRLLMESNEGEILRPGAEAVKYMLMHDHQQMFSYHDENDRSGLEVCLHIIDRLLGTAIEDNAASEVGGLAAELVEKAGHERLGPFLPKLLEAVATRLASAEAAPFIQSLILVFARLSLVTAHDVVEFLSTIQIHGQSGLQVVLSKWLENSVNFAGYDEIRQNVIALSKLYSLDDQRVAETQVKGDLIMPSSDRIMTRSRAKQNPDQFTIVPAPLKILKVLIEELLSASGQNAASTAAAAAAAEFADEDNDDDGWEDDPDAIDLNLGSTKNDLMGYLEASNMRHRDDETQAYLTEFFIRAARENVAKFGEWYGMLTEEEKGKLNELANSAQA